MPGNPAEQRVIRIAPYDQDWPHEFAALGQALRLALGAGALRIDHIGSTSVPGLAAKDVIDIQITVAALEPAIREALKAIGYVQRPHFADHIPPGAVGSPDDWAKWVFKEAPGGRATNVHVRVAGQPNQRLALLFRDFLRSNGVTRDAYERVKAALARLHPEDMDAYTAVKDPVCDIIFEAAETWAAATNWAPGPTDA
jgi:GrpB-like predicted nucleotidyltransferase (UPF0157 family)